MQQYRHLFTYSCREYEDTAIPGAAVSYTHRSRRSERLNSSIKLLQYTPLTKRQLAARERVRQYETLRPHTPDPTVKSEKVYSSIEQLEYPVYARPFEVSERAQQY